LLTHRQTDKQTKSGKNITSLAEVIAYTSNPLRLMLTLLQVYCMVLLLSMHVNTDSRYIWCVYICI